jgi:prevent-host-death family protein
VQGVVETIPLTHAGSRLGELVSRARAEHEPVMLTEQGQPVVAIIAVDELEELQQARDVAELAECEAILAEGGWAIPHQQAMMLLDVDDATYFELIAEIQARGAAGISDDELFSLMQARRAPRTA